MAAVAFPRAPGGGLSFIRANPVAAAFEREEKNARLRRKEETDAAVDSATRQGLAEAFQAQRPPRQAARATPEAPATPPMDGGEGGEAPTAAPQAPSSPPRAPAAGSDNPLGGVVARLASVPGAGSAALRLAQQGERMQQTRTRATVQADRQNAVFEQRALVALAKGDMPAATHWAGRAGFQIPPELAQNQQAAGLFARGGLLARGLYPNKQQALAFTQAYVQSGGNVDRATAAAGQPRPADRAPSASAGSSGRMSPTTYVDESGNTVRGYWDPRNPAAGVRPLTVGPAGAGGAPPERSTVPESSVPPPPPGAGQASPMPPLVRDLTLPPPGSVPGGAARVPQRAPGQGSTPREANIETRRKMLEAAGLSPQEAAAIAGGAAVSANTLAGAYGRIFAALSNDAGMTAAQREAEINKRMSVFGANWRERLSGARPAPPPPPTGGQGGGLGAVQAPALPPARTDQGAAPAAPAGAAAPRFREGQTATNPATGQRMIFRGGRWEPMQ